MSKFKASWRIFRHGVATLIGCKKLMLFPAVNLLGWFIIWAFFLAPLTNELNQLNAIDQDSLAIIVNFFEANVFQTYLVYLLTMLLLTFFNVAFYSEILHAFNTNNVSISRGLRFAISKLRAIVIWSLLAGIVGLIIRRLEDNVGFLGVWIVSLIGFAWSVASVFVIPVIVREDQQGNPLNYLRTSTQIISRTWGEAIIGFLGISYAAMVTFAIVVAIFVLTIVFGVNLTLEAQSPATAFFGGWGLSFLLVILAFVVMFVENVVIHLYKCGLYVYATEGVVPGGFDKDDLNRAWIIKS